MDQQPQPPAEMNPASTAPPKVTTKAPVTPVKVERPKRNTSAPNYKEPEVLSVTESDEVVEFEKSEQPSESDRQVYKNFSKEEFATWRNLVNNYEKAVITKEEFVKLQGTHKILKGLTYRFFAEALRKRKQYVQKSPDKQKTASPKLGSKRSHQQSMVEDTAEEIVGDPVKYFQALRAAWHLFQVRGRTLASALEEDHCKHPDLEFLKKFFNLKLRRADVSELEPLVAESAVVVAARSVEQFISFQHEGSGTFPKTKCDPVSLLKAWCLHPEDDADAYILPQIAREITRLLNKVTAKEIKSFEHYPSSSGLFQSLFRSCTHDAHLTITPNLLHLLSSQDCLRVVCLPWLETLAQGSKTKEMPELIQQLDTQLPLFMKAQRKIPFEISKLILGNPRKLFWEKLLILLSKSTHKKEIIELVERFCDGEVDPSPDLEQIFDQLNSYPHYFTLIKESPSLGWVSIREALIVMQSWDSHKIFTAVKKHKGLHNIVAGVRQESNTKVDLDEEQINAIEMIVEEVIDNCRSDQSAIYYAIKGIAEDLHRFLGDKCQVRHGLISFAAELVSAQELGNNAVYGQLDPGNGKTIAIILICLYYLSQKKKAVYVCVNRLLMQQAQQKLKEFNLTSEVTIIMAKDLRAHFNQDKIFVFDEYYHAIVTEDLKYDESKQLSPLFDLGFKEKAILTSGHRSDEFTKFLNEFYQGNVSIILQGSLVSLLGHEQPYKLTAKAHATHALAIQSAVSKIQNLSKTRPLFVFGIDDFEAHKRFQIPSNVLVSYCKDFDAYISLKATAETLDLGVIGLPPQYAFGVDIRFSKNAAVVIVSESTPQAEDVRQMLARGNRSLGTFEGFLFYVGDTMTELAVQNRLSKHEGRQFNNGAQNLSLLKKLPSVFKPAPAVWKAFTGKFNGKWMVELEDLKEGQPPSIQDAIEKARQQVLTEERVAAMKQAKEEEKAEAAKKKKVQK